MFLRKLVVIFLPLLMLALLCLLLPLLEGIPFWTEVFKGLLLGAALALLLPLSGATKRREPFAGLLLAPTILLLLTILCQYLLVIGIELPLVDVLRTSDGEVVLLESTFLAFMAVQTIRTKK